MANTDPAPIQAHYRDRSEAEDREFAQRLGIALPPTDQELDQMATDAIASRSSARIAAAVAAHSGQDLCESGWTGDRCAFRLDHSSPHSNEEGMILDEGWGS